MNLQLYNTATGAKEAFEPLEPNKVKMYVCGPTVYNRVHIGNARPVVVFDTLFRLLQTQFDEVIYARNITDIDDKIMKAAKDSGDSIKSVSSVYAQAYFDDMAALGNLEPTITPYATEHVAEMITMINTLVDSEHAYEAEGHVLFAVKSMADYGKLSNRSLEDMLAGARVEVAPYKKYAGDFVLWKPSSDDEPGWDSPWGRGRPGWHIECSAMIEKHLGETIDIHGGGRDLTFPHHENELAQSQCAHGGKQFVRYWMHNGYINIGGEKMSKSLGNFKMVNDLLEEYPGEVLRFALLSSHYRSEANFTSDLLEQAKNVLDTFYGFLRNVQSVATHVVVLAEQAFYRAMLDDLNTPIAISEMHALAKAMNKADGAEQIVLKSELLKAGELLGLLQADPEQWFQQGGSDELDGAAIESLIAERKQAKLDKDYARSDEIRAELQVKGVILEDSREGTSWKRA
ncbi:MAG: cysteinyl-tRNA synthetase [Flavobacteriales bacterium]|jgi:cysteinyl-tRNA synthetase